MVTIELREVPRSMPMSRALAVAPVSSPSLRARTDFPFGFAVACITGSPQKALVLTLEKLACCARRSGQRLIRDLPPKVQIRLKDLVQGRALFLAERRPGANRSQRRAPRPARVSVAQGGGHHGDHALGLFDDAVESADLLGEGVGTLPARASGHRGSHLRDAVGILLRGD